MDYYSSIRKIAKSDYYQSIFSSCDKGLRIFENDIDFTPVQMYFLSYLNFYSNLYTKVYMNEVDSRVLKDYIYEDAFSYYEKKKREKEQNKRKNIEVQDNTSKRQPEKNVVSSSTWIFRSKKNQK